MFKVKISIHNEMDRFDENVFVEIEMPYVPRVGDLIWLTHENDEILQRLIEPIKENYNCVYNDRVCVEEYMYVSDVCYKATQKEIWVELIDDLKKMN